MSEATAGVFLGDRRVGTLGYRDGSTWFDYDDREPGHPVLGQGFETDPTRRRTASGGVPAWFANLLPEPGSGLRSLIGKELGRDNPHDFQLITYIGEDLPGAVRVVSDSDLSDIPELAERPSRATDARIRFSLAGVQEKFSMRWEGKGLLLPMSGRGGNWIVKLPDRRFPQVPQNEFSMLTWARLAGIDVPEIGLFEASQLDGLPSGLIRSGEFAFGIKRFDRVSGGRIHQEDFAQVREVSVGTKYERASYSGLAAIIDALCRQDIDEYVRRLAAIIVMGNLDAHLKNWTIRYPGGRNARLSPAYDFVSVSAYEDFENEELAFAVNGGRRADLIILNNFQEIARRAHVDMDRVSEIVTSTVAALVETWSQVKMECPVPNFVIDHIEKRLATLPLIREVRRNSFNAGRRLREDER